MKQTRFLMGMHITVEVIDQSINEADINTVFDYFSSINKTFSTYTPDSEISRINAGVLEKNQYSQDMRTILELSEQTKKETNGFFDISHQGKLDPSGLVKGWAIWQAAQLLKKRGAENFYIDAGGDVQVSGHNAAGEAWIVGIKNPFDEGQIVKVVKLRDQGIATSGTYIRGQHVYNPMDPDAPLTDILSLSVIGPNVYEADRMATAAFAMQQRGIYFLEQLPRVEGYSIDQYGVATCTSHFQDFVVLSSQGTPREVS